LASLGANTNAKRAARAHFVFNVMGVLWMLIAFYGFTAGVLWLGEQLPASFRSDKHTSDIAFNLAIFHTSFNLINICLLVGFVPLIARVVTRWIPDPKTQGPHRLKYISQNLVDVGELNLPEAEKEVKELGQLNLKMIDAFKQILEDPETDLAARVAEIGAMEDECDQMAHDITDYLVRCATNELSASYAGNITALARITAEFEETADCVKALSQIIQRKISQQHDLTPEVSAALKEAAQTVKLFLEFNLERLFRTISATDLKEANRIEGTIDDQRHQFNRAAMVRMQKEGNIRSEMLNIDLSNQLEKMGNHALNVIETAHEMSPSA
jgi:phosphate:Na+ symporter